MMRLGIAGPGRITARVMNDMMNAKNVKVTAIASRDLERAKEAAAKYGAEFAYGSYLELAESDEVDCVYIANPHPFHEATACMMMEHGKAVICEKPAGLNDGEVSRMVECARKNNVFYMEAMWTRFMPAVVKMRELINEGAIGEVRHVTAHFSFHAGKINPADRVYDINLGGGGLLDLGVYPLMQITGLLGYEPEKVQGLMHFTEGGVDFRASAQMIFANGATAQFFCGMDAVSVNDMVVHGTKGIIRMPESWRATSFVLEANGEVQNFDFGAEHEGHHYEFDHVAECLEKGLKESPVVTMDESVAIAKICTELRHQNGFYYPSEK